MRLGSQTLAASRQVASHSVVIFRCAVPPAGVQAARSVGQAPVRPSPRTSSRPWASNFRHVLFPFQSVREVGYPFASKVWAAGTRSGNAPPVTEVIRPTLKTEV